MFALVLSLMLVIIMSFFFVNIHCMQIIDGIVFKENDNVLKRFFSELKIAPITITKEV